MNFDEHRLLSETVFERARSFSSVSAETVLKSQYEADLNFMALVEEVRSAEYLARRLADAPLDDCPGQILNRTLSALDMAAAALRRMDAFNPIEIAKNSRDPRGERNAILVDAQNSLRHAIDELVPALAFLGAIGASSLDAAIATRMTPLVSAAEQSARLAQEQQEIAQNQAAELQAIVTTAKETLQKGAITEQAIFFQEQAREHREAGNRWLTVTAIATVLLMLYAWRSYAVILEPATLPLLAPSQIVQVVTAKVLLLSTLLAGAVWCGKIYRAHRHNYVVNKHRENALSSFEAFARSAADTETKAAVLVQATTAVFAPQHSGFGSTEADPAMPTAEILRAIPLKT